MMFLKLFHCGWFIMWLFKLEKLHFLENFTGELLFQHILGQARFVKPLDPT